MFTTDILSWLTPLLLITLLILVVIVLVLLARGRGGGGALNLPSLEKHLSALQQRLDIQQHRLESFEASFARMDALLREEFGRNREELLRQQQATREETGKTLLDSRLSTEQTLLTTREETAKTLRENREELGRQFKEIRETMEGRLVSMQNDNALKLEEMRKTVDEKLQETVERRFSESFTLISDRLEQVHKGLGEMQTLANGVGDLKKVLSNVKTRGNLGEYQLGAILGQILSPEQYIVNAQTKPRSQERVEFAIKLPGKSEDGSGEVLLPIDSKFPIEDYERLIDAYEGIGGETPEAVSKRLETSLRRFARDIRDKYINPPLTTDFAIMFVPTEGLYAEVLRSPGLFDSLQREFHVTVVGPTNLVAFLSSLQMGFRTLAVEKRSSEVWRLLGTVKTEFGNFASVLDNVKKKLSAASSEIDKVDTRTRVITRKLRDVQELPTLETPIISSESESE
ncbi:MAG: DNA recombination protein RmuC [Coriobacteriales bacterium]|jgi:DNA recombination protein RmuC|nr:DNA recombination protein RmuC [Coriobacteriales bacterium]